MFCSNCGKEIGEEMKFCPNCGMKIIIDNSLGVCEEEKAIDIECADRQKIEIICPYCGSNQVYRSVVPGMGYFVGCSIMFGILFILFKSPTARLGFGVLSLGSLFLAIILLFAKKVEKNQKQWTIQCKTCNKSFNIDIPNGKTIITNLKLGNGGENSSSGTLPWE